MLELSVRFERLGCQYDVQFGGQHNLSCGRPITVLRGRLQTRP